MINDINSLFDNNIIMLTYQSLVTCDVTAIVLPTLLFDSKANDYLYYNRYGIPNTNEKATIIECKNTHPLERADKFETPMNYVYIV